MKNFIAVIIMIIVVGGLLYILPSNKLGSVAVVDNFRYNNIVTTTPTIVKANSTFLHTLTINTAASGVIAVYDNSSATTTGAVTVALIKAGTAEQTMVYDVWLTNGLYVVPASSTSNITVSYK